MPAPRYRWWKAREKALVVLHYGPHAQQPWSTARIAAELGVRPEDVRTAAKRWGLTHRRLFLSVQNHGRLQKLYDEGLDDGSIAIILGCERNTVSRWRRRHGLPALFWGYGRPRPLEPRPPIDRNAHRAQSRGS